MGKSTTAAGYLLWYAMFVPDQTILIAAHKYSGAQEIMHRIRYAYELCPDHIRCGVISYNKGLNVGHSVSGTYVVRIPFGSL